MMLKSQHEEQMRKMREEREAHERELEKAKPLIKAAAGFCVLLTTILAVCVVGAAVGGCWWVLTGRPMFGG